MDETNEKVLPRTPLPAVIRKTFLIGMITSGLYVLGCFLIYLFRKQTLMLYNYSFDRERVGQAIQHAALPMDNVLAIVVLGGTAFFIFMFLRINKHHGVSKKLVGGTLIALISIYLVALIASYPIEFLEMLFSHKTNEIEFIFAVACIANTVRLLVPLQLIAQMSFIAALGMWYVFLMGSQQ